MASPSLRPNMPATTTVIRQGLPYLTRLAENPHARVGQWILGTAGLVVGMIHVGGVTRLTQSGLSMTTWSPLGTLPPLNQAAWQEEFARYKEFPEWQQRQGMTLRDFQIIYAWEYGHRMMGRFIGVAFTLPWIYFTIQRRIPTGYQARMLGLWTMGGAQGAVGWWMVRSGLGEDRRGESSEIRVQPVRLAAHLSMALATYGALVWTGLDILSLPYTNNNSGPKVALAESLGQGTLRALGRLRAGSWVLTGLTAATIASGALVAGNDAGRAYSTWPRMNERDFFVVPEAWPDRPWFWSVTKDTATVQGNHRLLATFTAATGLSIVGAVAASGPLLAGTALTPQVRQGLVAVGVTILGQYSLGVATLLNHVPISLAAAHQVGSLAVFTSGLYLTHALRYASRRVVKQVIS